MIKVRALITTLIVMSCLVVPGFASPAPLIATPMTSDDLPKFLISNIQNSERIEVAYVSYGCFHNHEEKFIFLPASVSIKGIGQKDLTWKEMASLDRYVAGVAQIKEDEGWCTTTSTYTLTLFQNDTPVMKRIVSDTQCLSSDDMLTFGGLIYSMKNQNRDQGEVSLIEQ